jgi:acyl-CoA oxidase
VIHSPSLTAAKFWPGELGLCANWALVYAQLMLNGKKYGVQAFFVPIRDENYNTLPGIDAGDIGPKVGYHAK